MLTDFQLAALAAAFGPLVMSIPLMIGMAVTHFAGGEQ